MLSLLIMLVLMMIFLLAPAMIVRILGRRGKLFQFMPANAFGLVALDETKDAHVEIGGGAPVVDVIHAVPGKRLDKTHHDYLEWEFVDEDEDRGLIGYLLYQYLGVQWLGIFRYLRENIIRDFRFGRDKGEHEYHVMPKDTTTKFVHFSGSLAVEVKDVETGSIYGINIGLLLIIEREKPAKSVLKVADSNAVLTALTEQAVIRVVGGIPAEEIVRGASPSGGVGGARSEEIKNKIVEEVKKIDDLAVSDVGLRVIDVQLRDISYDAETERYLELQENTRREADALRTQSEGERDAELNRIAARAREVQDVILPAAQNERTVRIREAMAYENNKTVRTYAPGQRGLGLIVQDGIEQAAPKREPAGFKTPPPRKEDFEQK